MDDKYGRLGHPNYFGASLKNLRKDVPLQLKHIAEASSAYEVPEDFYVRAVNTLLLGETRVGKTWLLHCIMNNLIRIGIDQIYYLTVDELISAHKTRAMKDTDIMWITFYGSRDVLFLDALGSEYKTDSGYVSRTLEKFLRHRFNYNKLTYIGSRYDGDTMEKVGYDKPVRDFISGEYKKVVLYKADAKPLKVVADERIDTVD